MGWDGTRQGNTQTHPKPIMDLKKKNLKYAYLNSKLVLLSTGIQEIFILMLWLVMLLLKLFYQKHLYIKMIKIIMETY